MAWLTMSIGIFTSEMFKENTLNGTYIVPTPGNDKWKQWKETYMKFFIATNNISDLGQLTELVDYQFDVWKSFNENQQNVITYLYVSMLLVGCSTLFVIISIALQGLSWSKYSKQNSCFRYAVSN